MNPKAEPAYRRAHPWTGAPKLDLIVLGWAALTVVTDVWKAALATADPFQWLPVVVALFWCWLAYRGLARSLRRNLRTDAEVGRDAVAAMVRVARRTQARERRRARRARREQGEI